LAIYEYIEAFLNMTPYALVVADVSKKLAAHIVGVV
jgi:hypothetical protein